MGLQDFLHAIIPCSLVCVCGGDLLVAVCKLQGVCVRVYGQGDKSLRANLNQRECTLYVDVCRCAVVVIIRWPAQLFITAPRPPMASQLFPSQYISAHDGERP